ncbi:hypothetical protein GCM10010522_67960 [Kribbella solani]
MELVPPELLLPLELPELPELPEPLDPESSELVAVPEPALECFAETTATDTPVAPTPSTAVATAATDARRTHPRRRPNPDSPFPPVLTMQRGSPDRPQPHSKKPSSHHQVLLNTP